MIKETVIFDLDGTLLDSMVTYSGYASDLIAEAYNIDLPDAKERYMGSIGQTFPAQLELLFPGNSDNSRVATDFAHYKARCQDKLRLFDDSLYACRILSRKGYALGVCSSTAAQLVHNLIKRSVLAPMLSHVTGISVIHKSKLSQLSGYKRRLGNLIFVGDTPYDAEMASEAGVEFVAVAHTFSEESFRALDIPVEPNLTQVAERITYA